MAKLAEEANRKLPAKNTMVQHFTLYTNPKCHNVQNYRNTDNFMMLIADHTV